MENTLDYAFVSGDALPVSHSLIFSDMSDAEFRIICAYRATQLQGNPDLFDQLSMRYDSELVARTVSRYRKALLSGTSS